MCYGHQTQIQEQRLVPPLCRHSSPCHNRTRLSPPSRLTHRPFRIRIHPLPEAPPQTGLRCSYRQHRPSQGDLVRSSSKTDSQHALYTQRRVEGCEGISGRENKSSPQSSCDALTLTKWYTCIFWCGKIVRHGPVFRQRVLESSPSRLGSCVGHR